MIIIFDLDGTLINTIDDLGQACNYALAACGYPTHPIEDYPRLVGNGINRLIERALPEAHRNEETVLRLRKYFVPYYDEHNCELTCPYDGIIELLQTLKEEGHTLAVASNKYQAATEKIVAHFFPGVFDVVLGERENVARKPDPQIVWDIVESLEDAAKPLQFRGRPEAYCLGETNEMLYVGDSLVDAETAKAAKIPFVACTWGFCTEEQLTSANPNYMVQHPIEILTIVEDIL
jgi:phosphoglycolate phosphatase